MCYGTVCEVKFSENKMLRDTRRIILNNLIEFPLLICFSL